MKQLIQCLDNGKYKRVPHAFIDGSCVDDQLLEDVFFKIAINDDGFDAEICPQDADWFSGLNQKKLLADIAQYCRDEAYGFVSRPHYHGCDDVFVYDDQLTPQQQGFDHSPVFID